MDDQSDVSQPPVLLNPPDTLLVQSNGLVASMDELPLAKRRTRLLDCSGLQLGRPTKLTKEYATRIVDGIGQGQTMRDLVKTMKEEGLDISTTTIYRWIDENQTFREQIASARRLQAHSWADESKEILDSNGNDILYQADGKIVVNNAQVHRDKTRVELRMKLAGMFNPMYKEDRNSNTINVQVNTIVDAPKQETRDEWLARQRQALPKP